MNNLFYLLYILFIYCFSFLTGKKDVYICMPTGSGKSLCFQLPAALHKDKVALVFSPLLALIKVSVKH